MSFYVALSTKNVDLGAITPAQTIQLLVYLNYQLSYLATESYLLKTWVYNFFFFNCLVFANKGFFI